MPRTVHGISFCVWVLLGRTFLIDGQVSNWGLLGELDEDSWTEREWNKPTQVQYKKIMTNGHLPY